MTTGTTSGATRLLDRFKRFKKSKPNPPLQQPTPVQQTREFPVVDIDSVYSGIVDDGYSDTSTSLASSPTHITTDPLLGPPSTAGLIDLAPSPLQTQPFLTPPYLGATCLPSTRVSLRRQIAEWASEPHGTAVFWLMARSSEGKSTIARSVARTLEKKKGDEGAKLGGCWLFERRRWYGVSGGVYFVRAVAAQLAETIPKFAEQQARIVKTDLGVFERGIEDQFLRLILDPLKEVAQLDEPKTAGSWVLVVDGIDECQEEEARTVLRLLFKTRDIDFGNMSLRVFVTSTPGFADRLGLLKLSSDERRHITLARIPTEVTDQDLVLYLRHKLSSIERKLSDGPRGADEVISMLAKMVSPSFHNALTLSRFLTDSRWDSGAVLKILLEHQSTAQSIQSPIEEIYRAILTVSRLFVFIGFKEGETEISERFQESREIIGSIIALADALSIDSLSMLLSLPIKVIASRLDGFRPFIDIPVNSSEPLLIHHVNQSFRNQLVDPRNRGSPFWVDEVVAHRKLASCCLKVVSESGCLRENICNLPSPGTLRNGLGRQILDDGLPEHVRYSCRNWIYHLKWGGFQVVDGDDIDRFVRKHLLHWVEALALLSETSRVIPMLETLLSCLKADKSLSLRGLLQDAVRFMLYFQSTIHDTPLQLYSSALLFSPRASLMRQAYESQVSKLICRRPAVRETWPGTLQSLIGHDGSVNSVTFSADGKKLVSASEDKTVRIWDSTTGSLRDTLEGHMKAVNLAVFSPTDPQSIASVGDDKAVCLWNEAELTTTRIFEGHGSYVTSVAFSPDGTQIASSADDIRIRDADTGAILKVLEHNGGSVRIAYSPDGTKIMSVSWTGGYIKIWEAATGTILHTIYRKKSRDPFSIGEQYGALAFSPDGKHFATAGYRVCVWNADTWTEVCEIYQRAPFGSNVLAFSPCGKILALSGDELSIDLWDIEKQTAVTKIKGKSNSDYSRWGESFRDISISPDGKKLAAVSEGSAYLFDVETGNQLVDLTSQGDRSYSVSFSPMNNQVLLAGRGGAVLVDAATGKTSKTFLNRNDETFYSAAFSLDGKRVVAGTDTGGLRVWDIDSEDLLLELDGHDVAVYSADFSSDGTRLATASGDSVRIWDLLTGQTIKKWSLPSEDRGSYTTDRTYFKHCIAFSVDDNELAVGSSDKALRWWDVGTGKLLKSISEHGEDIRAIARCPDGVKLATASADMTIKLWDWKDKKVTRTLQGHTDPVSAVSFSPDGVHLVSGAKKSIGFWDITTGALLRTFALECPINDLAFSPDGSRMASAMLDGTIQLLDKHTLLSSNPDPLISISFITFSPDNTLLAAVQSDHAVRLVDTAGDGREVGRVTGHTGAINSVAFSTCSTLIATTSDDCTVKLWSLAVPSRPTLLETLEGHENWVRCTVFSPNTDILASGADDRTICIWSLSTGKLVHTIDDAHADWIRVLAFSPSGGLLASASDDKTVRLWDITAGLATLVYSLEGHTACITALAFSRAEGTREGREKGKLRLASAADDETIRLWDIESGKVLDVPKGLRKGIKWIRFSQDERWLETDGGPVDLEKTHNHERSLGRRWVYVKDDWVQREGQRLLHIPDEYRVTCSAYDGKGVLALGHTGGLVCLYEYN